MPRCERLSIVLVMLVQYMCSYTSGDFTEAPTSVFIEVEGLSLLREAAVFRCQHQSPDANVIWSVNGSSVGQFSAVIPSSIFENGSLLYTLTIPARLEYNGTVVVCLAFFFDGSPTESTSPATLIFRTVFEIIPSSLNMTVEQEMAIFYCQLGSGDDVIWRVNRSAPSSSISIENIPITGGGFNSSLSIATLLDYNQTVVECGALFYSRSPPLQFAIPVTLLIQDTPGKVKNVSSERNYSSNTLITLWDPLPSLDLTNIDPDIVYSVDLVKVTCGENISVSHKVVSVSNAVEENLDLMQIYKATIVARNNVITARNGPSVVVEEKFMSLHGSTLFGLARNGQISTTSYYPVPSYYHMSLESLYDHGKDLEINISVQRNEEMITMRLNETLPSKSVWKASILAYGCESNAVVNYTELSTHDFQNMSVSSPLPGQIRVTGYFIQESTATGILIIVYSLTNKSESDVHYISKGREQSTESNIIISVLGLNGSLYGLSSFTMENGLPFREVASIPKKLVVDNNQGTMHHGQLTSVEYSLHSTSAGVCISCTFLDSSTTDCVAVVHQQISQLSSSGLMSIESSHKFNRSGDTAYGCIEGINIRYLQVGVLDGKRTAVIESGVQNVSCPGCLSSTGAALVAVCVILVIALIAALVVIVLIRKVHLHRVHMESVIPITSRVSLTRYEVQLIPESCSLPLEYRERVALDPPPPTPDSPTTQSVVYESNGLNTSTSEPLTVEVLKSRLQSLSSKWYSLGEALSLKESLLDDILADNGSDDDCLEDMLNFYKKRSDLKHTWEEIEVAMMKIGYEETIGDRPLDRDDVDVQQGKDVPYQHKHFLSNKQPADEEDICSKHGEQGGSGDSSESEDSREPSASLEGESKCSEENRPAPSSNISHISDNLEDYESELHPSLGSKSTLKGDDSGNGELRATEEEGLGMPLISPCSLADQNHIQIEGFLEKLETKTT